MTHPYLSTLTDEELMILHTEGVALSEDRTWGDSRDIAPRLHEAARCVFPQYVNIEYNTCQTVASMARIEYMNRVCDRLEIS